jgi:hypothetical protein
MLRWIRILPLLILLPVGCAIPDQPGTSPSSSRSGNQRTALRDATAASDKLHREVLPLSVPSLIAWDRFERFTSTRDPTNGKLTLLSPVTMPGHLWDELIVSWNCDPDATLEVEARFIHAGRTSLWYQLGSWSMDTNRYPRTSINGQRDADAEVRTDLLHVYKPASAAQVRLKLGTIRPGRSPSAKDLRLLTLAFSAPPDTAISTEPDLIDSICSVGTFVKGKPGAWGKTLELPRYSQADYPEGIQSWCSPTSVTMILHGWHNKLGMTGVAPDVVSTARNVHDPGWPGTGNWTFNTAYIGTYPGLASCVARLPDIASLEDWLFEGNPVVTSVSYDLLKGRPTPRRGDGHLVVVIGFTSEGDVILHDPGVRMERVLRTIPRADFLRAWEHSRRTVYLTWARQGFIDSSGSSR